MRFRTVSIAGLAMVAAVLAMPAAAKAQGELAQVKAVATMPLAPMYIVARDAQHLQSDTGRLALLASALQLRSTEPAPMRMASYVARDAEHWRPNRQPAQAITPLLSERTAIYADPLPYLTQRTVSTRADTWRTRTVATTGRPPARLQT